MADRHQDALDRYWEDLAAGRTDGPHHLHFPHGLDPTMADAVRRLHAAVDVDAPSPAFVSRLQEELMLADATTLPPPLDLAFPLLPNGRAGSTRGLPSFVPALGSGRDRGWLPRLLAAAMILLTLGLTARVFTPDDDGPRRQGGIPAVVVPESTSPPEGVTDVERLVEVLMPAGIIPAGARTDLALEIYTLPSGISRKDGLDPTGCCPGLHLNFVLAGTATLRADGPMQLHPTGGSLEPIVITAGTDVVVGPGDALVYREEVAWTRTVPEGGSLSFLWGVASNGVLGRTGHPDDGHLVGPVSFPTSDYPISIAKVTLAPGATLHPELGAVQLYIAATEDARVGELSGNAFKNLGREPAALYVMSVGFVRAETLPSASGATSTADTGASTPLPDGVSSADSFVEVTLPPLSSFPAATTEVGLAIEAVPAGSTTVSKDDERSCCPYQNVSYVLEGTSTFRAWSPTYVLRAGGGATPEVIAVGSKVSLVPGDAILYLDDWEWTVTGDGPMRLLSFWMMEGSSVPSLYLTSWVMEDLEIVQADTVAAGPLTLRLGQVTIDAGATLPSGSAAVQVAVALPTEDARFAMLSDYGIKNVGKAPADLYVASLSPAAPDATLSIPAMAASPVAASPVAATPVAATPQP